MSRFRRVLVLATDDDMRQLIVEELDHSGHLPVATATLDQALRELSRMSPDVVVIDGEASVVAIQNLLDRACSKTAFVLCDSLGADAVVTDKGHDVRSLSKPYRLDNLLEIIKSLAPVSRTD